MKKLLLLLLIAGIFSGCDTYSQDDYTEQYVVQGYLGALATLPRISLSKTVPIDEYYDLNQAAVSDAQLTVSLLDANGNVEKSFAYVTDPDSVSLFKPLDTQTLVLPNRTYALHVTFPNKPDVITAKTVIPDTMKVLRSNGNSFVYQQNPQYELALTRSLNPNRQSFLVCSLDGQEKKVDNLVPIWHPDTTPLKDRKVPEMYSSPIINESNYLAPDGTVKVQLPWVTIVYYGRNKVITRVVDDAYYNFFRTQSVQQGGSTLSPGEIPNAATNIIGGTGVFGSFASVETEIYVTRSRN